MDVRSSPTGTGTGRFGTFAGVFTPNILTILGIILFLRIGWVVGQAGLWGALSIVLLANVISFLTGLSLSAVATSMNVRAGGNYYLISRSLGLEVGGAIGIPLYLSQAISVAFYIIGFTEALRQIPAMAAIDPRLVATAVALLFVFVAYIGADFALKIQYVILAILIAALVSFFAGGWDSFIAPTTTAAYGPGLGYWAVFAVFFPAVTGIEVGTSLSGDLKDPSRSIPLGTIASIVVTAVIYLAVVFWFAFHVDPATLVGDNFVIQRVARWPALVLYGVWASTLSSALGSVLAAPRTLQAIAYDSIVPKWLAGKMGSPTEPRVAVLITGAVAVVVIWMGDLDFVAPIISMFFLNTYGMVNLAASIEKLVSNPSYRPRFRIPWWVSLLGAIGCYAAMFLINPWATLLAIVISYGLFFLFERRRIRNTWGDVRSGIWLALTRHALLTLSAGEADVKNWRPNIIVFTGQPHNRQELVDMAEWLIKGQGLVTFFQLLVGDVDKLAGRGLREAARKHIQSYIDQREMTAFAEADIVPSFEQGVLTVVQAHGVGRIEPNAVLFGWSRSAEGRAAQLRLMRSLLLLEKATLFLNVDPQRGFGARQTITIWSKGRGGNADLMLLLAYIIQQHRDWQGARLRLVRVIDSVDGVEQTRSHMDALLRRVRVAAEPVVLVREGRTFTEIIATTSTESDLTVLGLNVPEAGREGGYGDLIDALVTRVGTVLMVRDAHRDENLLDPEQ